MRAVLPLHGRHPGRSEEKFSVTVPCLLSFLGTGSFDGEVEGINQLREQYEQEYGQDPGAAYYSAGDYVPVIPVTYWSFRFMIGLGVFSALGAALILWLTRRGRMPSSRWVGWLGARPPARDGLRELLRLDLHRDGPSALGRVRPDDHRARRLPGVSASEAATSLIVLTLLYAVLAVVEIGLMVKYIRRGADPFEEPPRPSLRGPADDDAPLAFAY